ncbi:MAG: YgjV family protein [Alphaproteobacteria bacterium]|nr:YgjV family protein [Alphaproteobacteria bacterium]
MSTSLLIGNLFSFLAVACLAVSAVKQSKKDLMLWQIGDPFFGILSTIALSAYAALVINCVGLVRNFLAYRGILTKKQTIIFLVIGVIFGLFANNLSFIGLLPIIASAGYTVCVYITKNEQQMRYALTICTILWFIHNFYIQSFPSALANIILCVWIIKQIIKYRKNFTKKCLT